MEIRDGMKEDRQYRLFIEELEQELKLAGRRDLRLPLEEAVERIVAGFDPLKIVLFGSLARGEYRGDSDVDLLVVIPDGSEDGGSVPGKYGFDKHEVTVEILRALKDLPFPKDVVITTPEEIARRGISSAPCSGQLCVRARLCMSEPERLAEVGRWLRFATEDLSTAELIFEQDRPFRQACFHAQQAAEKAIKAALIFLQVEFSYRHDLDYLRTLLPDGWLLKDNPPDLAEMTAWAIRDRYPGDLREAAREDATATIEQAREVLETAREDLARYGYIPEETG